MMERSSRAQCLLRPSQYIDISRYMDIDSAILALGALAQSTRIESFRLLVRHEPVGLAAGEIAKRMGVAQNTMSSHLAILQRAGLISSARESRSIIYRADIGRLRDLTLFLVKDCCGGDAARCEPLLAELLPCC